MKAVITGQMSQVGVGYILSVQLVPADTGDVLLALRETAADSNEVIVAIDRLSKQLRERVGESLKTIRANEPLPRVTTQSLEALRLYAQALRVHRNTGDAGKALAMLEEATEIDTLFASAYLKIGGVASGTDAFYPGSRAEAKAYELRDRLTDRERYIAEAYYHGGMRAVTAYRTLLGLYPDDAMALNNLSVVYSGIGETAQAVELARRVIELDSTWFSPYWNLIWYLGDLGQYDEAEIVVQRALEMFPGRLNLQTLPLLLLAAKGDYDTAEALLNAYWVERGHIPMIRQVAAWWLASLAQLRGKLSEAERYLHESMATCEQLGWAHTYLGRAEDLARLEVHFRNRPERGLQHIEAAFEKYPLSAIDPLDRPYLNLAALYADAGRVDDARRLIAEREAMIDSLNLHDWFSSEAPLHDARGHIARSEGRFLEAIAEFRLWQPEDGACAYCVLPHLGRTYDMAGEPDSVIAIYERYLATPGTAKARNDIYSLARIYERLGQLYEARGDSEKAVHYHGKFVDLWKDADPDLQPRVEAARRALEALAQGP
jgi:tetratricopeptide (TPR) repeat protein